MASAVVLFWRGARGHDARAVTLCHRTIQLRAGGFCLLKFRFADAAVPHGPVGRDLGGGGWWQRDALPAPLDAQGPRDRSAGTCQGARSPDIRKQIEDIARLYELLADSVEKEAKRRLGGDSFSASGPRRLACGRLAGSAMG